MEEYFKVLLGGLFGIATIVVAVLSLTSNIINGKCLNLYVNKMKLENKELKIGKFEEITIIH